MRILIRRWTGAVLAVGVLLGAGEARAQYAEGNVDNDGFQVPMFPVPGGSVAISNSGEGTVAIPLTVPPGVHGMVPSLTLRCSSAGEDEGLGRGWLLDLGYPDAIRRTTRFGVPAYGDPGSTNDVFTFGGQDLVPVGGGRYKTKIDSFQRIEWLGDHWVVWEKDGTRLEYGRTDDERSAISSGTYAWHLGRVVDTFGNMITFSYEVESGELLLLKRLLSIEYGVPSRVVQRVALVWEPRADVRREASHGDLIVHDVRLDRIETWSGGVQVRKYELTFADATAKRLVSVQEIAPDGTSLPPWTLQYQEHGTSWTSTSASGIPYFMGQASQYVCISYNGRDWCRTNTWYLDTGARPADVDGDGFPDLVVSNNAQRAVFLHNGSRTTPGWSTTPAPGWVPPREFMTLLYFSEGRGARDQGSYLLDVNGDGFPDFVSSVNDVEHGYSYREVALNCAASPAPAGCTTNTGWGTANAVYSLPADLPYFVVYRTPRDGVLPDQGVRFADVNGDGLADIVYAEFDRPSLRRVYINNGINGWSYSDEWSGALRSLPQHIAFERQHMDFVGDGQAVGTRLFDINADGLADFVYAQKDVNTFGQAVYLNNGHGWAASSWSFPVPFIARSQPSPWAGHLDNGVQVADMNGDGFPDVVVGQEMWLNNRTNGFDYQGAVGPTATAVGVTEEPWVPSGPPPYPPPPSYPQTYIVDAGTRLFDLDGNGIADVIRGDGATRAAWLADSSRVDLLSTYTNPLGGTSTITYGAVNGADRAGSDGQMPFTRTVAVRMEEDARLGDPVMTTDYTYSDGYFEPLRIGSDGSRSGREFRGFGSVHVTRGDWTSRLREFYLDEGRKGLERSEELQNVDNDTYSRHEADYSSSANGGVYLTLLDKERFFQYRDGSAVNVWRQTDFAYDAYGNAQFIREHDWSSTVGSPGPIRRSTYTRYIPNDGADSYIVGLPFFVVRYGGDVGANALRADYFCYDGQGCGRAPTQGAVTQKVLRDFSLFGKQLASGSEIVTTTYAYDGYGNQTRETNGRGFSATTDWATNGSLFPYSTTRDNPNGQQIRLITEYDKGLGVLTRTIGLNLELTQYGYDGLGRLKSIKYPGDSDPSVEMSYNLTGADAIAPNMRVLERLDGTRTRVRYEYFDRLGRALSTSVGEDGTRWITTGFTKYDSRGRKASLYEPFSCGSEGGCFPTPGEPFTAYEYRNDKLSRTTNPDNSTTSEFHLADGVEQTDEHGIVTRRSYDAFGQLIEVVTDAFGSGPSKTWTTYEYDGLGGLRASNDARKLRTTYFYDARSLLRGMSSPDGSQSLRNGYKVWNDHDEQGNQTYHWSGSDVWQASYDALDRRTWLKVSRDTGRTFASESEYRYDEDFTIPVLNETMPTGDAGKVAAKPTPTPGPGPSNAIGRLTTVVSHGVPVSFKPLSRLSYDVRGRVTKEEFSNFDVLNAGLGCPGCVFSVEYGYDRENKVVAIRDPRGRLIRYSRNLLGQIANYGGQNALTYNGAVGIAAMAYDLAGRVSGIGFGNGFTDFYTPDWRGRVTSVSGGPLQANYIYGDPPGLNLTNASESIALEGALSGPGAKAGEEKVGAEPLRPPLFSLNPISPQIAEGAVPFSYQVTYTVGDPPCFVGIEDYWLEGAPEGISITRSGLIEWTPDMTQVGQSFTVTVWASGTARSGNGCNGESHRDHVPFTISVVAPTRRHVLLSYSYDRLHRLETAAGSMGSTGVGLAYAYDATGNLLSVVGPGAPNLVYSLTSGTNRLGSVQTVGGSTLYATYDQHGNLTQLGMPWVNGPANAGAGPAGLLDLGAVSYTYDRLGRLASYTRGTAWGQIDYDGRGRKLRRTFGSGTEVYFYTVWGQVLASYKTGSGWTSYLLADGRRLGSVDQGDQFRYFHADRLGSTRAITNSAGQVVWSGDYLPFGSEVNSSGTGDNFRFTGQELEPNLGAYDYGARYYDPTLRRFLQIDSFLGNPSDPRTLNRYSYTLDNPTAYTDPTGHCGEPEGFIGPTLPCPPPSPAPVEVQSATTEPDASAVRGVTNGNIELPEITTYAPNPANNIPSYASWDGSKGTVTGLPDGWRWNSSTGEYEADFFAQGAGLGAEALWSRGVIANQALVKLLAEDGVFRPVEDLGSRSGDPWQLRVLWAFNRIAGALRAPAAAAGGWNPGGTLPRSISPQPPLIQPAPQSPTEQRPPGGGR